MSEKPASFREQLEIVYGAYAGRMPQVVKDETKRAEWKRPAGFQEELENVSAGVGRTYMPDTTPSDQVLHRQIIVELLQHPSEEELNFPSIPHVRRAGKNFAKYRVLQNSPLQSDPHVLYSIKEATWLQKYDASLPHIDGLPKSKNGYMGNMFIGQVQENKWELHHRYITPEYREKGLFPAAVAGVEHLLKERAVATGKDQELFLSVGQPELLLTFLRLGYTYKTPEDEVAAQRILAGDPAFFLEYEYGKDAEKKYVPRIGKSLYCYDSNGVDAFDKARLNMERAVRVSLHKRFAGKEVESIANDTRTRIEERL